jgi:hypothetical protein
MGFLLGLPPIYVTLHLLFLCHGGLCLSCARTWLLISKRLGSGSKRFVSLGEGFVLINLVINLIPVFYLLFLKLPVKFGRGLLGLRDICQVNWLNG